MASAEREQQISREDKLINHDYNRGTPTDDSPEFDSPVYNTGGSK